MGSKARVILHPSLQLGQTRIPLSRLNKVKVTVESDNNLNVKSNLTFEGIVFKDCEDYLL